MSNIIECHNVCYSYSDGSNTTSILNQLNLSIKSGESVAILGRSGCGKSTLLNLLGGLDRQNSGEIIINNTKTQTLNQEQLTKLRSDNLSFIYQLHHLLKDFDALNNVMMPLLIKGMGKKQARDASLKLLDSVGLAHRISHFPGELSGGERQRVAIARALVTHPKCLLADEPTGNLDRENANEVLSLMIDLHQQHHSALIIVTHDENIAAKMQRTLILDNGKIS